MDNSHVKWGGGNLELCLPAQQHLCEVFFAVPGGESRKAESQTILQGLESPELAGDIAIHLKQGIEVRIGTPKYGIGNRSRTRIPQYYRVSVQSVY